MTTPRRQRRPPGEIRSLLLSAAQELFGEHGYAGVSTREIARRAGVAETFVFRHFGTKEALFAEAVLAPITEFANAWIQDLEATDAAATSTWELNRDFVGRLYDVLHEHRRLILAYIAMTVFQPETLDRLEEAQPLLRALTTIRERAALMLGSAGLPPEDADLNTLAVFGMVSWVALFEDWLATGGSGPRSRDEIVDHLTRVATQGFSAKRRVRTT